LCLIEHHPRRPVSRQNLDAFAFFKADDDFRPATAEDAAAAAQFALEAARAEALARKASTIWTTSNKRAHITEKYVTRSKQQKFNARGTIDGRTAFEFLQRGLVHFSLLVFLHLPRDRVIVPQPQGSNCDAACVPVGRYNRAMSVVPVTPEPGDMLKIVALLSAPVLGFLMAFSGLGYGLPVCVRLLLPRCTCQWACSHF